MYIVVIYLVVSLAVGIYDLRRFGKQDEELASYPIGDVEYYIKPKKLFGIHNWIFLPSWLLILVVILVIARINRLF